jgi:hypothetical protein
MGVGPVVQVSAQSQFCHPGGIDGLFARLRDHGVGQERGGGMITRKPRRAHSLI